MKRQNPPLRREAGPNVQSRILYDLLGNVCWLVSGMKWDSTAPRCHACLGASCKSCFPMLQTLTTLIAASFLHTQVVTQGVLDSNRRRRAPPPPLTIVFTLAVSTSF